MHRPLTLCCVMLLACGDNGNGRPPTLSDITLMTLEDTALTVALPLTATDPAGVTFAVTAPPSHGTLTGAGPTWTFTPAANYNGIDSLMVRAEDRYGSATATVTLTIVAVNDAPLAGAAAVTTAEDTPLEIAAATLLGNASDVDADTLSLTAVAATANTHGTVGLAGDTVTYTPAANYNGDADFTYTVADGHGGSATGTVTVSVTPVADVPVAVDDTAAVTEDAAATAIDVLGNDNNPDGVTLSIASVMQPVNGTVAITGGGSGLTYAPAPNFCTPVPGLRAARTLRPAGPDTFTYTLSPGGTTATVTVTVTCVDDPPVAVGDTAIVVEDSTANAIDVLSNDSDIDGGPRLVASITQPAHGSVAITGSGTGLSYTPTMNYCNDAPNAPRDTFTYTLAPGTSSATVSVLVTCACGKTRSTDFFVGSN